MGRCLYIAILLVSTAVLSEQHEINGQDGGYIKTVEEDQIQTEQQLGIQNKKQPPEENSKQPSEGPSNTSTNVDMDKSGDNTPTIIVLIYNMTKRANKTANPREEEKEPGLSEKAVDGTASATDAEEPGPLEKAVNGTSSTTDAEEPGPLEKAVNETSSATDAKEPGPLENAVNETSSATDTKEPGPLEKAVNETSSATDTKEPGPLEKAVSGTSSATDAEEPGPLEKAVSGTSSATDAKEPGPLEKAVSGTSSATLKCYNCSITWYDPLLSDVINYTEAAAFKNFMLFFYATSSYEVPYKAMTGQIMGLVDIITALTCYTIDKVVILLRTVIPHIYIFPL